MLKVGIESKAYFNIDNYKSGLKKVKLHGYDCVDYRGFISPASVLYTLNDRELNEYLFDLRSVADNNGITINQMHGLWPHDDSTSESRDDVLIKHKKALCAAGKLGCKYFVIHPAMPYGWGEEPSVEEVYEITAERFLGLLPTAKDNGVVLCIENMPFRSGHSFSSVREVKNFVRKIDDPNMKVCFDTGHCNVTGDNQYESVVLLGNDLAALHVHDDINRQDRHLIPYQGEIDWDGFIKGLQEIRFNGCLSLEAHIADGMPEPAKEQMQIALAQLIKSMASKL